MTKNKINIIAGMPRSATTFIYHTFSNHPDVFLPIRKEIEFFSVNKYRGIDWYLKYFRKNERYKISLDISPGYFLNENVPKLIYDFNPNIKVILIVRNVVDWIISYYKHYIVSYQKNDNFNSFLKNGCSFKVDGIDVPINFIPGSIAKRIKIFQDVFNKNILIFNYSVMKNNPLLFFQSAEKYFNISSYFNNSNFKNYIVNSSKRKSSSMFNFIMKKDYVADLIYKIFPRKLTIKLRKNIEKANEGEKNNNSYIKNIDKNIINKLFTEDILYVKKLFNKSNIIYGNGEIFEN